MSFPEFTNVVTVQIVGFLRAIGIDVRPGRVSDVTFLPGILIDRGVLVVDETRLRFPGDLLHEAGHLAVTPPDRRPLMVVDAGPDAAEEMMAIAWSYAAALYLNLDPALVFHAEGYQGGGQALLENFREGRYIAVPMLQWVGMTYDAAQAKACDCEPYPQMRQWVRTK